MHHTRAVSSTPQTQTCGRIGSAEKEPSFSKWSRHAWSPQGWVTVMCWVLCPSQDFDRPVVCRLFKSPLDRTGSSSPMCIHRQKDLTCMLKILQAKSDLVDHGNIKITHMYWRSKAPAFKRLKLNITQKREKLSHLCSFDVSQQLLETIFGIGQKVFEDDWAVARVFSSSVLAFGQLHPLLQLMHVCCDVLHRHWSQRDNNTSGWSLSRSSAVCVCVYVCVCVCVCGVGYYVCTCVHVVYDIVCVRVV